MNRLLVLTVSLLISSSSMAIDWSDIDGRQLTLFYPGQASWEWLLTTHKGSKSLRKGAACLECHETEERQMGETLVSGKKLETSPVIGKPGSIDVTIKAAIDNDYLYIRGQWKDPQFNSGNKLDKDHETKFAVMFDTGKVKEASVAGCWGVCHVDSTNMPASNGEKRELYVSKSRKKLTRNGGGGDFVDKDTLANLLKEEKFMEFWQARMTTSTDVETFSGYILDKRHIIREPLVTATATKKNNTWTVEFKRKLKPKQVGSKTIMPNTPIQIGFAVHDDYALGRFHYVSFGQSLSLNGKHSDIQAKNIMGRKSK